MTLKELEYEFSLLPKNYKTKDIDNLNKKLIKRKEDVSFLKNILILNNFFAKSLIFVAFFII